MTTRSLRHQQMCVDGVTHRVVRPGLLEIDMGNLAKRVNTRIGPPGTADGDSLPTKAPDRRLDRLLDRRMIILALPAGIAGAVILDIEAVARHQPITVPCGTGVPRRNSSAASGLPPAFCKVRSRMAPSPQAIVSPSSSAVPGRSLMLANVRHLGCQQLDPLAAAAGIELEPGARRRGQSADMVVHLLSGFREIDPGFLLADLLAA
jgi:hypothetical protein